MTSINDIQLNTTYALTHCSRQAQCTKQELIIIMHHSLSACQSGAAVINFSLSYTHSLYIQND